MTPFELMVVVAAQLAGNGRSIEGAVAAARELLDRVRADEPDLAAAHDRARAADAMLRRSR
jgi:hypothetical protein